MLRRPPLPSLSMSVPECFKPSIALISYKSLILFLGFEDGVDSSGRVVDLVWDCDLYWSVELKYLSILQLTYNTVVLRYVSRLMHAGSLRKLQIEDLVMVFVAVSITRQSTSSSLYTDKRFRSATPF